MDDPLGLDTAMLEHQSGQKRPRGSLAVRSEAGFGSRVAVLVQVHHGRVFGVYWSDFASLIADLMPSRAHHTLRLFDYFTRPYVPAPVLNPIRTG